MIKKATLYTSALLNGSWLLASIDTALWLHKSDGYKQVNINCVSNISIFNLFNILLRFKNLSSYYKKSKIKKLLSLIEFSKSQDNSKSELANFAVGNIDRAYLTVDDLEIKFVRVRVGKKNSILNNLILSFRVIVDYFRYFSKSALKNRIYLKYQVAGVYSGLHVLSEALRSDYKSYGSVFHCRIGILAALYKLHSSVKDIKNDDLLIENNSYVCGPAQEYVYGFFSRFMSDRGACFIEMSNIQQPYIKRELKDKYYSRLKLYQIDNNFNSIEKEKITEYYSSRIEKPWEIFNSKSEKYTSTKEILSLNGLSVIIYLHSFTDAQYVYGYDGYDGYHDLMDWCLNTISLLNSNEHVSKVIIKPHPGINPVYHPGDTFAINHLKSKISKFDKVQWADFHFDVNHINSLGLVVGITHHGSVAEELVFKKIPVIASTHSYWGEEYKFGYWWKDVKEYEKLISSKSITELVVTENQTNELYRYAMKKYFNLNSDTNFDVDSTWKDMLNIYDGVEDCHEHGENMEQVMRLVSQIDPEDRQFKKYIKTRLQRINLLKDVRENNN